MEAPQDLPPSPPPLPLSSNKRPHSAVDDNHFTDAEPRQPKPLPKNWPDVCSKNKPIILLKDAMALAEILNISEKRALGMYNEIMYGMRVAAQDFLKRDHARGEQDTRQWDRFLAHVKNEFPVLRLYEGSWPVEAYMSRFLRNKASKPIAEAKPKKVFQMPMTPLTLGGQLGKDIAKKQGLTTINQSVPPHRKLGRPPKAATMTPFTPVDQLGKDIAKEQGLATVNPNLPPRRKLGRPLKAATVSKPAASGQTAVSASAAQSQSTVSGPGSTQPNSYPVQSHTHGEMPTNAYTGPEVQSNSAGAKETRTAATAESVDASSTAKSPPALVKSTDASSNPTVVVKSSGASSDPPAATKPSPDPPVRIKSDTSLDPANPTLPLTLISSLYALRILPFETYRICNETDLTSLLNWDSQTRMAYFLMFVESKKLTVVQCVELVRVLGEYAKKGGP